jgi:glycogen synthase
MSARVLMTADAVGGVWTYAIELARALAHEGLKTTITTMGPQPTTDRLATAADIPGLQIVSSDFRLEWMDDPWRDVAAAGDWLLQLESQVQPIVVHLNGFAHGALPWRAPTLVVGHSDVVSWNAAVGSPIAGVRLDAYRQAVAAGLRSADWVAAPSAAALRALVDHFGPLSRTSVIPNGRDARRFPPGEKESIVFTAGRLWDDAKNIAAVTSIAASLPWPVVVAGEGDSGGAVSHVGQLSEPQMANWLGRASIAALPAKYEPFGLVAMEAALAGCALVLGDIPSLREVWGSAAEFVDPADHGALRSAIVRLIDAPARRRARADAARQRALEFTPARMARAYLDAYRCAAARRDLRRIACAS